MCPEADMVLRIRSPYGPPKDKDLGPACGRTFPYAAMRKTIEAALIEAAARKK